jgi:hypothetical protein
MRSHIPAAKWPRATGRPEPMVRHASVPKLVAVAGAPVVARFAAPHWPARSLGRHGMSTRGERGAAGHHDEAIISPEQRCDGEDGRDDLHLGATEVSRGCWRP